MSEQRPVVKMRRRLLFFALALFSSGSARAGSSCDLSAYARTFSADEKSVLTPTLTDWKARRDSSPQVYQAIYAHKYALKTRMSAIYREGNFDRACYEASRKLLLAYNRLLFQDLPRAVPSFHSIAIRTDGEAEPLRRAGDVILESFPGLTHSAIKAYTYPGSYSHTGLIVESDDQHLSRFDMAPFGGRIEEIDPDRAQQIGETVRSNFRFFDSEIAKLVAEKFQDYARARGSIAYDYAYDDRDPSKFFCSEPIELAYGLAEVRVPLFGNGISEKNQTIANMLALKMSTSALFPEDIDLDPRFLPTEFEIFPNRLADDFVDDLVLERVVQIFNAFDGKISLSIPQIKRKMRPYYRKLKRQLRKELRRYRNENQRVMPTELARKFLETAPIEPLRL